MSEINVHVSVSNAGQVDRFQSDAHRNPVVHQEKNAEMHRNEAEQKVRMPVQPESAEGKVIDPNDKRREQREKQKKRNRSPEESKSQIGLRERKDSGYIVDLEA
ncbi:MAG TPA: hypothetical protein PLE24_06610 [Chitinispirillaceae bacterium]|nr:hypothetical protein [Chitinispirillaceae bacterium]